MSNPAQMKLHENEKAILKLEEESLKKLIGMYQGALNALKVEELTLTNRLGKSQDMARLSQTRSANNPTLAAASMSNSPIIPFQIPTSVLNFPLPSISNLKPKIVNEKSLNLTFSPFLDIQKVENDEEDEEEDMEEEEEEDDEDYEY